MITPEARQALIEQAKKLLKRQDDLIAECRVSNHHGYGCERDGEELLDDCPVCGPKDALCDRCIERHEEATCIRELLSASPETQGLIEKWRASAKRFRATEALGPESKDYGEGRAVTLEKCADELEATGARGEQPQPATHDRLHQRMQELDEQIAASPGSLQPEPSAIERLRMKEIELRAKGLRDFKIWASNITPDTSLESMCEEVLAMIEALERGDVVDISDKLESAPTVQPKPWQGQHQIDKFEAAKNYSHGTCGSDLECRLCLAWDDLKAALTPAGEEQK